MRLAPICRQIAKDIRTRYTHRLHPECRGQAGAAYQGGRISPDHAKADRADAHQLFVHSARAGARREVEMRARIDAEGRSGSARRAPLWLLGVEYYFCCSDLIALDCFIWVNTSSTLYQAYQDWAFDQTLRGLTPSRGRLCQPMRSLGCSEGERPKSERSASPQQPLSLRRAKAAHAIHGDRPTGNSPAATSRPWCARALTRARCGGRWGISRGQPCRAISATSRWRAIATHFFAALRNIREKRCHRLGD